LIAVDLHAAVEGEDGAAFREVDVEGGGRGLRGELLGDHAVGDFLEGGVLIGGVAFEEAVELAGVEIESALEDGIELGGALELLVFEARGFGAIVEEQPLAAGGEAEDRLLGFQIAELDPGVLVGGDVEEVVAGGIASVLGDSDSSSSGGGGYFEDNVAQAGLDPYN
jgi:hypothetical protein